MSKKIYVQAQADHIESLSRGSPISAIEELIWNALDADAREVRVDLITNGIGGIEAIRVSDNGLGIDIPRADTTFGSLGGSWKRMPDATTALSHRSLHGRNGKGRFKSFALGCHVEWRTTIRSGEEMTSYRISGDADAPGVFELEQIAGGPECGTEVTVTNVRVNAESLLLTEDAIQHLASTFALYLKSYPDVHIFFNGIPVSHVIVQKRITDYRLTVENGAEARLEVIEWRGRFVGSGRLVFAGPDGFRLHEQPAGVRASGVCFTAYLISQRFPALNAENALLMDELNPEVRMYIDAAKKTLRAHFAAYAGEMEQAFINEWEERIGKLTPRKREILRELLSKYGTKEGE